MNGRADFKDEMYDREDYIPDDVIIDELAIIVVAIDNTARRGRHNYAINFEFPRPLARLFLQV